MKISQGVCYESTRDLSFGLSLCPVVQKRATYLNSRCGMGKVVQQTLMIVRIGKTRCVSSRSVDYGDADG